MASDDTTMDPDWLIYMKKHMTHHDSDDYAAREPVKELLQSLRELLESSNDDTTAVTVAIEQIRESLRRKRRGDEEEWCGFEPVPWLAADLETLMTFVLDLVFRVEYPSPEHDRLAALMTRLKALGPAFFDVEDEGFTAWNETIVQPAWESWRQDSVGNCAGNDLESFEYSCRTTRSNRTFLARLYQNGTLHSGYYFAAVDIPYAFKEEDRNYSFKETAREHRILQAALYVLIAGEAIANEIRNPTKKREQNVSLGREEWLRWTKAFEEVATAVPDAVTLEGLREHAREAAHKMRLLMPEVFTEKTPS